MQLQSKVHDYYGPINFTQAQETNYDFAATRETDSSLFA